jgi:hypothetical protein
MPELPLTEYYSLFPNLITRQDISGYAEQDEVIHELLHGTDTGEHNLLNKAKTSHSRDFLDNYPDLKQVLSNRKLHIRGTECMMKADQLQGTCIVLV